MWPWSLKHGLRVNMYTVFSVLNYTLYRRDRFKRKGGGVCAYISNDIKCEVLDYSNRDRRIEIPWLKCYFNYVMFICCMLPPTRSTNPTYLQIN